MSLEANAAVDHTLALPLTDGSVDGGSRVLGLALSLLLLLIGIIAPRVTTLM